MKTSKSVWKQMSDEELIRALGNGRGNPYLRELIRRFKAERPYVPRSVGGMRV